MDPYIILFEILTKHPQGCILDHSFSNLIEMIEIERKSLEKMGQRAIKQAGTSNLNRGKKGLKNGLLLSSLNISHEKI